MIAIVIDTETTGFPRRAALDDPSQPWLVQLAWAVLDEGRVVRASSQLIWPGDRTIPEETTKIHGISTELATAHGVEQKYALEDLLGAFDVHEPDVLVAHNFAFDAEILRIACAREGDVELANVLKSFADQDAIRCTMQANVGVVDSRFGDGRPGKWPRLAECHAHYFGQPHADQHDALGDVMACARVYAEMQRRAAASRVTP